MRNCFLKCTRVLAFCAVACALDAQFPTINLSPRTIEAFDAYSHKIEQQLAARWQGHRSFLAIEEGADLRARVLGAELSVRPSVPDNPIDISDGLVHDWVGDVFIPNTGVDRVLQVLQDFDHHSEMYPAVTRSRLVHRQGNHIVGYWRLEERNQIVPVVLDAIDDATYDQIAPGKWTCRAYAKDMIDVQNAGTPNENKLPLGRGKGFLWRLYAYWSLEAANGGVLAECRTLSLSRSIPPGLGWAVKPFVKNLPRDSLTSTLDSTRAAAAK